MAINLELEKLYYEDRDERTSEIINPEILAQHTTERIARVAKLLPTIDVNEIWNCHYLAYLLHHSEDPKDYVLAHEYAKQAVAMGSQVTKWLYAATLDRMLVSQGKPQKFGTQHVTNDQGVKQLIQPIDVTTTDAERREYGVSTLDESTQNGNSANH